MPALVIGKTKWVIGADDLALPSFCACCARLICFLVLCTGLWSIFEASHECDVAISTVLEQAIEPLDSSEDTAVLSSMLGIVISYCALCCIGIITMFLVMITALRGTIMDASSRNLIPKLLVVAFALFLIQIAITAFSTYVFFSRTVQGIKIPCWKNQSTAANIDMYNFWIFLRVATMFSWFEILLHAVVAWLTMSSQSHQGTATSYETSNQTESNSGIDNLLGSLSSHGIVFPSISSPLLGGAHVGEGFGGTTSEAVHAAMSNTSRNHTSSLESTGMAWEARCRVCCRIAQVSTCNLFGGVGEVENDVLRDVAIVMARFFKRLDLVPSDLIASLLLLRAEQKAMAKETVKRILRNQSGSMLLSPSNSTSSSRILCDQDLGWSPDPPSVASTASSHAWLWNGKDCQYRAKSRVHIQLIREARAALSMAQPNNRSQTSNQSLARVGALERSLQLDEEAMKALRDASYFGSYMLGIYGWMLFTYMRPHHLVCKICCNQTVSYRFCGACAAARATRKLERRRGCCDWDYHAFRHNTGLHHDNIVYLSSTNYCGKSIPYCIAVDGDRQTVVIACRGTLSLADIITDALMSPAPLEPYGDRWGFSHLLDENSNAHSGMLRVASWMREDIDRKGVLARLFGIQENQRLPDGESEHSIDMDELPNCQGFDLVVLGHSLGAGVASVLSLLLQGWIAKHQVSARCIAFSPPGCVFDRKLADVSSQWISSPFVGKDMIVRGSWHSLIKLRAQMLEMLRRAKVNKATVLRSALYGSNAKDLLWSEDEIPDTPSTRSLLKRIQELEENKHPMEQLRMFPPGRLLHLAKVETTRSGCFPCSTTTKRYIPMWVDDREALDEFLMSKRMLLDHFPDFTLSVIKQVVSGTFDPLHFNEGSMNSRQMQE